MPAHRSHGREYIEPPRHDGLPDGHARDSTLGGAGHERKPDGTLVQGARMVPALGGKAHKGRTRLSHKIDAPTLTPESQRRARALRKAAAGEIAATVGGGHCGIVASLLVKFAAQKTAAAEEAFQMGDYETHRKLSESARMDLLYAREHAAKEAQARASVAPVDVHALVFGNGEPRK